jgi:hypothetical protein
LTTISLALDRLESRLQSLVESSAARLLPGDRTLYELSSRLMEVMLSGVEAGTEEGSQLPNLFIFYVHPEQAKSLQSDPILIDGLRQCLSETAHEIGLELPAPLALRFEPDSTLAKGEFHLQAVNSLQDISQTNDVIVPLEEISDEIPAGAFLVVDGVRIFPLERAVVNIGRRPDNHLVVDDPRVSRLHAQLRLAQGRYVILDLDSSGGTWVNGQRVNRQALFPGDVISLSGVPMVYGQDGLALSETQEYVPPS